MSDAPAAPTIARAALPDTIRRHLLMHPDHRASDVWQENTVAMFDALMEDVAEARAAARKEVREAIERIDHPCHDVCIGNLHADCQCAAWIRQEALDSLSTDTREEPT